MSRKDRGDLVAPTVVGAGLAGMSFPIDRLSRLEVSRHKMGRWRHRLGLRVDTLAHAYADIASSELGRLAPKSRAFRKAFRNLGRPGATWVINEPGGWGFGVEGAHIGGYFGTKPPELSQRFGGALKNRTLIKKLTPGTIVFKGLEGGKKRFYGIFVLSDARLRPSVSLHEIGHAVHAVKNPERYILFRNIATRMLRRSWAPSMAAGALMGLVDENPTKAGLVAGLQAAALSAPAIFDEARASLWAVTRGRKLLEKRLGRKIPIGALDLVSALGTYLAIPLKATGIGLLAYGATRALKRSRKERNRIR